MVKLCDEFHQNYIFNELIFTKLMILYKVMKFMKVINFIKVMDLKKNGMKFTIPRKPINVMNLINIMKLMKVSSFIKKDE